MNQDVHECSQIAFYGSLMSIGGMQQALQIQHLLEPAGSCLIRGDLYDLGDFPALLPGEGEVTGEIYRILHPEALEVLDEYEGVDPDQLSQSLFVRRKIRLLHPNAESWVYYYNHPTSEQQKMLNGKWNPPESLNPPPAP